MRMAFWKNLTVLAVLGFGAVAPAAQAVQFEQQEIDQSRFIIVAAPGGELGYKLLILEQIKDSRPCWSETGSYPSIVEPLLLSFDFTGICNRIVDSNGFSMRAAGEDQGLNYSLRIIPQDNDLVLVAASNSQRNTWVEIGRTYGLPAGFSRINLNPGWRLTRRAYEGKAIGHVYLTYDQPVDPLVTDNLRRSVPPPALSPDPVAPTMPNPLLSAPSVIPVPAPPPAAPGIPPVRSPRPSDASQPPAAPASPSLSTLLPPTSNAASDPANNAASDPATESAVESARPTPRLAPLLPPRRTSSAAARPAAPAASTAPTAVADSASSTDSFQVIVEADSAEMQDKVRAVAPGALLTTINGQVVMQVGIFRDLQAASQLQQKLSQQGLPTAVIPVR
ncbi:MAG: DUF3747 domain-containing protein [Pegethrix bostrychoides GSE-TBD4-15B]|uniref:DUF3747 domain-containing protein n=1 Tax=Pegethrix bostrychoides GSE-TBD4-15B TaxID=2839662 RepID=A0A951U3V3_9CYAN|nr:DUF3747 domain-containing protein [Pegethrix bostrychoides GSE-TBD4-15B]